MKSISLAIAIAAGAVTFCTVSSAHDFDHHGEQRWSRAQEARWPAHDMRWRDRAERDGRWEGSVVERRFERAPRDRDEGRIARWRYEPRERVIVEQGYAPEIVGQVWERPMSYATTQVIEVPAYPTVVTVPAPAPAPVAVVTRSTTVAVKTHRAASVRHVAAAKPHTAAVCAAPTAHVAAKAKPQRLG